LRPQPDGFLSHLAVNLEVRARVTIT